METKPMSQFCIKLASAYPLTLTKPNQPPPPFTYPLNKYLSAKYLWILQKCKSQDGLTFLPQEAYNPLWKFRWSN